MRYQYYQFVEISSSRFLRTGHKQQERVNNTVSILILWKNNQRKKKRRNSDPRWVPHTVVEGIRDVFQGGKPRRGDNRL